MPVQKQASPVAGVLKKLNSAVVKTRDNETRMGGGNLPGGINGGIAKFMGGKIDFYKEGANKGKPYMSLVGVVTHPSDYRGMQTRNRVDLFAKGEGEKAKTEEDMVDIALNELRKLGISTKGINAEDIPDLIDAKAKEDVHFRFHTSQSAATKQYPNPRVWENWDGMIEHHTDNGEAVSVVEDDTADSNGEAVEATDSSDVDWAAVGEAAEGGDTDAQQQIKDAAEEAGLGEAVDGADNWIEAAALLGGEAADGGEAEEPAPEKGDTVKYKPPKAKKSVEAEVTAVFEGKKTVNLKDENGNSYKGVSWDQLER